MLPQGVLWQSLRQRALGAIPKGALLDVKNPLTLARWQSQGTYTITAVSSAKFTVAVAPTEFGGALLSDASLHLDHALEHQATMANGLSNAVWSSAAWQVVTVYYWAYFIAMALTRLVGRTVWFVTPEVARQFTVLLPSGSGNFTQGTYEVSCGDDIGLGQREVKLEKRQRRVHEQLWATTFAIFDDLCKLTGTESGNAEEERLYLAIRNASNCLGSEWPSSLRNVVNYRPGFAYGAPRSKVSVDSYSYLADGPQSVGGIIDRLENSILAMQGNANVEVQPRVAAHMLGDLTLLLDQIVRALHEEIAERTGVDRRWQSGTHRFSVRHGLFANGHYWPS